MSHKPFRVGERVQLHAATDQWMQGDRYGTVVGYGREAEYYDTATKERGKVKPVRVRLDKSNRVMRFHPDNLFSTGDYDSDVSEPAPPRGRRPRVVRHETEGRLTHSDLTVERHHPSGDWIVQAMVKDRHGEHLAVRRYNGYERDEAEDAFIAEFSSGRSGRMHVNPHKPRDYTQTATRRRMKFFSEHAGGVVGERAKGALALSRAEDWASSEGVEFSWEPETDIDDSWMSEEERRKPHEWYVAIARHPDGRVASLGGIVDPDSAYQRVVNAELALELMNE